MSTANTLSSCVLPPKSSLVLFFYSFCFPSQLFVTREQQLTDLLLQRKIWLGLPSAGRLRALLPMVWGGGEGRECAGVKREARGRGGDPVVGLLGRVAVALATTYHSGKGHEGIIGSAPNSLRLRAISGKA